MGWNRNNNFDRAAFLLVVCLMATISISAVYAFNTNSSGEVSSGQESGELSVEQERDTIIQEYISFLAQPQAKVRSGNNVECELPGMGVDSVSGMIHLTDAEEAGLLSPSVQVVESINATESKTAIAQQQHDLVVSKFGTDAWDNVTYTLEEREPLDGTLGYRNKSTGEIISQGEYERTLFEYWNDVAVLEGVLYEDIFLMEGESVEEISNKRVDLFAKYSENIPVELTTVSNSETYNVYLAFDGKTNSEDGFSRFRFVIDNGSGEWVVHQGLTWHEPYPDVPTGD